MSFASEDRYASVTKGRRRCHSPSLFWLRTIVYITRQNYELLAASGISALLLRLSSCSRFASNSLGITGVKDSQ